MKAIPSALSLACGLLLAACIPSVHPYYRPGDLVADPALVGHWRNVQETSWDDWTFAVRDDSSYAVTIADSEGKSGRLIGHLFELGGQRYLDLIPEDCDFAPTQHELIAFALFPGHLLVKADMAAGGVTLTFFNWDWLKTCLAENPDALPHRAENDSILLTADTEALQRFVLAHSDNGELFRTEDAAHYAPFASDSPAPPAPAP